MTDVSTDRQGHYDMATVTRTEAAPGYWGSGGTGTAGAIPGPNVTAAAGSIAPALVIQPTSAAVAAHVVTDPAAAINLGGNLTVTGALGLRGGVLCVTRTLVPSDLSHAGSIVNAGCVVLRGSVGTASRARIGGSGVQEVLCLVSNAGTTPDTSRFGKGVACCGTVHGGLVRSGIGNVTLGSVALTGTVAPRGDVGYNNDSEYGDTLAGPGSAASTPRFLTAMTFDHVTAPGLCATVAATSVTTGADATTNAATANMALRDATTGNQGDTTAPIKGSGAGGQANIQPESASVLCFAAGTRIDTNRGPVPVESLRSGDRVGTAGGSIRTIEWIGHRHVNCRRHPDPARVCPVRIARHAFGNGLPTRALLLSPDHAVFVDKVLVPVRLLVNGASIAPRRVAKVDYYHIELQQHDILLAEGLPVESYLETGGRASFANGGSVQRLYPDFAPDPGQVAAIWQVRGFAPLAVSDRQVAPIRERLRARAETLIEDRRKNPSARGSDASRTDPVV